MTQSRCAAVPARDSSHNGGSWNCPKSASLSNSIWNVTFATAEFAPIDELPHADSKSTVTAVSVLRATVCVNTVSMSAHAQVYR